MTAPNSEKNSENKFASENSLVKTHLQKKQTVIKPFV